MENRRKSEENEMQLKIGRKAWKISKRRFSQTVRRPISQCENFANPFRNAKISQPKIRNAKISQCENFAMRNFAMPNAISQCQNRFRTANFNFAMRKFRNAKFRNAKVHFALRNPLPLRNSYFQALSSSVINAEPP